MARKLPPAEKPDAPHDAPDDSASDLFVLMPDQELELAGRKLTVREYRFAAGNRARGLGKPLIDDLDALLKAGGNDDAGMQDTLEMLGRHDALVRTLMAESIEGADAAWMDGLSQADGDLLMLTWWTVCGRFFWRAVVGRHRDRMLAELRRQAKAAGPTSSALPQESAAPNLPTSPIDTRSVN